MREKSTSTENIFNQITGERVKKVRIRAGMSGMGFAKALFVTPTFISLLEHGKKPLTEKFAREILNLFPDVQIAYLFGETDCMTRSEEHARKISDAVDEMTFQGQFDQTMEDAARMIILSVLRKESLSFGPDQETTLRLENADPRIDGDSILYKDYAHRGKGTHDLTSFRISGDWIQNFSEELASYGEYLFRRKILNHEKEFEEVVDDSQR